MKKFLSLLLTGVMSAMLLAGCGTTPNKALLAKRILLCSLFAGKETG